ncbi:MAG: glycosyltransferase family 2 protein [Deltaproteobacteria bacterium]
MDCPKKLVIIPAYNEEKSIEEVIAKTQKSLPEVDILVIDDGSKDQTAFKSREAGAFVIQLPFNIGIGGAVQTGYIYAMQNNYDIAIQCDADGQHDPTQIKKIIEPIILDSADMVIGSRYLEKTLYKSKLMRRIGIMFLSNTVSMLIGKRISDPTSGFRAVNKKIIEYFSDRYPLDYPEADVLVRLNNHNFRMLEIPVEMRKRQGGKSSITPLKSIYYMAKVSLALIINAIRSSKYS